MFAKKKVQFFCIICLHVRERGGGWDVKPLQCCVEVLLFLVAESIVKSKLGFQKINLKRQQQAFFRYKYKMCWQIVVILPKLLI
jgi:hypothetical protein